MRKAALEKAGALAKDNWRVNNAWIEEYLIDEEYALAADLAKKSFKENPKDQFWD